MATKNLQPQTPGESNPNSNLENDAQSAADAAAADPSPIGGTDGPAEPAAEDTAALVAENERLKNQLQAERLKNRRDRGPDVAHLPDQEKFAGKTLARAVLTKDGWLPATPPKPKSIA